MVSAFLTDSGDQHLHDEVDVEVDSRELHFIILVDLAYSMEGSGKAALRAAFEECFTHGSSVGNVLSNKLMDGDVDHVELDS